MSNMVRLNTQLHRQRVRGINIIVLQSGLARKLRA
jgi:hypothetical protein